jgi:hypothetical protein
LNHALASTRIGRSCPPNALRISRAAPIGWDCLHPHERMENRHDLVAGTASGCMRMLGSNFGMDLQVK